MDERSGLQRWWHQWGPQAWIGTGCRSECCACQAIMEFEPHLPDSDCIVRLRWK